MLNRLNNIIFIFILLLLFISSPAGAEEISAEVSLDRSVITVGDPVLYRFIIRYNPSLKVTHPKLEQGLKEFEIRDYKTIPARQEGGMRVEETQYLLTLFKVGIYKIPSVEVHYLDPEAKSLNTSPLKLEVREVITEDIKDIRDIKGPLDISWNWRPLARAVAILIALLVAGWAIYRLVRRWRMGRRNLLSDEPEVILSPEEEALAALENLREAGWEDIKLFYSELSDILRRYVGRRYQFQAMEQTSEELEEHLKYKDIAEKPFEIVKNVLISSDLVKFARYIPAESSCEEIFPMMAKLIEYTKPKPFTETILKTVNPDTVTADTRLTISD